MSDTFVRSCVGDVHIREADGDAPPRLRVMLAHTNTVDAYKTQFQRYRHNPLTPMAAFNHSPTPLWVGRIDQAASARDGVTDVFWEGDITGLDIPSVRHTWDVIREMGKSQEYSYRFSVEKPTKYDPETDVITFPQVRIFEVSPVFAGATPGTGTVFARALDGCEGEERGKLFTPSGQVWDHDIKTGQWTLLTEDVNDEGPGSPARSSDDGGSVRELLVARLRLAEIDALLEE